MSTCWISFDSVVLMDGATLNHKLLLGFIIEVHPRTGNEAFCYYWVAMYLLE